jgi:uncharacterized membrane protein (DUF441 family)
MFLVTAVLVDMFLMCCAIILPFDNQMWFIPAIILLILHITFMDRFIHWLKKLDL